MSVIEPTSLVALLQRRAASARPAGYTFLADGENDEQTLSYAELDRQARTIAVQLASIGAAGQRVLILYPPGLDYISAFFGCLYAGAVAVPAYPPDPTRLARTLPRLQTIVRDAQAIAALTTSQILGFGPMLFAQAPDLAALRWIATDTLDADALADRWQDSNISPDALAFLQYTSGSTGTPKGVMLTHGNLLANERMIQRAFGMGADDLIAGWLPLYHDMGLIGNVLQPLYVGASCVLMSPIAFLQRPRRWLQAISKYHATTSGGPNFAYDLCVRKTTPEERAQLDLRSWQVAFTGAEPVRPETVTRFAEAFAPSGFTRRAFFPCYGLAEATLLVSGGNRDAEPVIETVDAAELEQHRVVARSDGRALIGCGRTILDDRILIVDPATKIPCAAGEVGEIWVSGPHVARGYWNRPELSTETFDAHTTRGDGPFLRTGDLGFLSHGELFVTGRLKDLIIIRGRNHYPQDLEHTIERSERAVRAGCSAAFSVDVDGEESLVVVCEVDAKQHDDSDAIIDRIRGLLAEEHEVQAHAVALVKSGAVPKTSSGKIQRRECRTAFLDERLDAVRVWRGRRDAQPSVESQAAEPAAPVDAALETQILTVVARRLGVAHSALGPLKPITQAGLDSLAAVELAEDLERTFGVEIPMAQLLAGPSVRELAREVSTRRPLAPPVSSREQSEYPLSSGQQALWLLHQLVPDSSAYNVAIAVRIHNALDLDALRRSFQRIVLRHPALRTSFQERDGKPVARVAPYKEVDFKTLDATHATQTELERQIVAEANRPFDLVRGSLLRVRVFEHASGPVMLIAVHHIVVDMWSLVIIGDELGRLYREEAGGEDAALTDLRGQYVDHVRAEQRLLTAIDDKRAAYWKQRLAGELPVLELPLDRPRPASQTFRGAAARFTLPAALSERLTRIGKQQGATLYMTLLAAYYVLLHRHTGQTDIIVGSATRGRSRPELRDVIGYFVNMMPLRADVSPTLRFDELLAQVRKQALTSFANSEYPFFAMVDKIQPNRDPRYSPIFQTTFTFQKAQGDAAKGMTALALGAPGTVTQVGGLSLDVVPLDQGIAQFDLALAMGETETGLAATFEYNSDLFDASTIERMIEHYRTLLESIAADSTGMVGTLPLLTDAERHQVLVEWNQTKREYPTTTRAEDLVAACATRTPDAIAVEHRGATLTYRELDIRANQLAHRLRALGVGTNGIVAVHLERSVDVVVAWLAIWKAGAAYLPIAADLNAERIAYMLEDSRAQSVITNTALGSRIQTTTPTVYVDQEVAALAREPASSPDLGRLDAAAPAYVIYTSGSTGKPKGSLVSHRSLCNLIGFATRRLSLGPGVRHATVAGLSFDASVFETWPSLACGATLCLLDDDELKLDGREMHDWLIRARITVSFVPTALLVQMYDLPWSASGVRTIWTGGDALPKRPPAGLPFAVVNVYGPAECTVICVVSDDLAVAGTTHRAPEIGRVVDNTQVYILEPSGLPSPIGTRGELMVAGDAVGLGYLHRPELTAEKFVANPFGTGRMYRTGDLARWLPSGVVEFLGRSDGQVKIRGHRIELGEIEATLSQHPAISDVIVVARDHRDEKHLVAYVAGRSGAPDTATLRAYLQDKLPAYMVPAAFVVLDQLPVTPNGKVDRNALPAPEWTASRDRTFVAPRTPTEQLLAAIWSQVLGVDTIGVDDSFFELGGHSLLATQVVSRARTLLGIELPLRSLFETPTVGGLARTIETLGRTDEDPILPVSRDGGVELSFAQQRLWFLDKLRPGSSFYNITGAIQLRGELDVGALLRGLDTIVARHESLRTTFAMRDDHALQVIGPALALDVPIIEVRSEEHARELATVEAQRPFDLARGPLMRASLLRLAADEHWLVMSMHHIVSDGWSVAVMLDELSSLYSGRDLAPLSVQYPDFAIWQRRRLSGPALEQQLDYWKQQLAGSPALLGLPIDRPRPPVMTYRGATRTFTVPGSVTHGIEALARGESATLFMTLLAAFQVLLARYSRQDDIVVGTPVAGRNRAETESLIGFFVNTLVIRGDLSGNPTFREHLARVREVALGAYAHQDLPFEKLVEELRPARDLSYTPLFQVMFALQNTPEVRSFANLERGFVELPSDSAKFDLTLSVEPGQDGLRASFEYNTDLFDASTIERMFAHYVRILVEVVADANLRIGDVPLLSDAERHQILVEYNDTTRPYPTNVRVEDLVAAHAKRTPDAVAVEHAGRSLTYDELDRQTNQLAHRLLALGASPGAIVAVHFERSLDVIIGWLACWKAGAAYLPIAADLGVERISYMLDDAQVAVLVTTSDLAAPLTTTAAVLLVDVDGERVRTEPETRPEVGSLSPEALAYVIYTSGSTGKPKGSLVAHRSLVNMAAWHIRTFGLVPGDRTSQVAALSFDVAVWETWPTLIAGATLALVREDVRADPVTLRDWLVSERITVGFVPTVVTEAMLDLEWPACDLRVIMTGGDKLSRRPSGLPFTLFNCYGPTECTVLVLACPVGAEPALRPPELGYPLDNTQIYLLEPSGQLAPVGVPGEIVIAGDCVGLGYLKRPELTAEKFVANGFGPGRMYRTGDLGRWLPDGSVAFLGRIDQQVKIRGFRIELGEIEITLREHPSLRDLIVIAHEEGGDKRLVAYVVGTDSEPDVADLRTFLERKLPSYMIPSAFVVLDALPLTPNGKVDRRALPAPRFGIANARKHVAPRTDTEASLAAIWEGVLRADRVGVDDNFFELGGHSLLATQVVSRVRQVYGVELPLRKLFEGPTVAALAREIDSLRGGMPASTIQVVSRQTELPLSFAQQRLWFLDQLEPDNPFYNIAGAVRLTGALDVPALVGALQTIIARHESLRTTFETRDGKPIAVIAPSLVLDVPVVSAISQEHARTMAIAEAREPFNLARGPLVRARILAPSADEHWLLLSMHHIVSDGWSIGVLMQELRTLYAGGELAPLAIQYADFAAWQRERLAGDELTRQLTYWKGQLAGAPSVIELPTDRPRPPVMTYRGATRSFGVPSTVVDALDRLSGAHSATLFMTLLAAFQTLLHRYSRQDDIAVGSPVAGRTTAETENLIGFFVNTLVLRTDLTGNPTFRELLARVREVALGAYAHQDVPFERLVEELRPERDRSHSPLFQVMLALQNTPALVALGGVEQEAIALDAGVAQFDLSVDMRQTEAGLVGSFEYNTDLFEASTIDRMIAHFQKLLEAIAAAPDTRIGDLALLTERERHQLLIEWNSTDHPYPADRCFHQLIEAQVERTPDAVALELADSRLTYRQLNAAANRLAHRLRSLAVGPESLVGICVDRSFEMIIGLLAIAKAGGAYVPLSPSYPRDRLHELIGDARPALVLVDSAGRAALGSAYGGAIPIVELEPPESPSDSLAENPVVQSGHAGALAYVIYTSGSTGKPKGVMVTHRSLMNDITWQVGEFGLTSADAILNHTSISFDMSVWELWAPLTIGARIVILPQGADGDAPSIVHTMQSHAVTVAQFVPTMLRLVTEKTGWSCDVLVSGGEALDATVAAAAKRHARRVFVNIYGPTETTVDATSWVYPETAPSVIPIGRPMYNARAYVLDARRQLVPVGVAGELYIGGAGVARGYLDRPELTAEKFVPNPFGEGRLYRTGDLVTWLADGDLMYLGRIDHQVKIRGFRIELGEIEAALTEHASIREAVALAREDVPGDKRLVAYVVGATGAIDVDAVRAYLKARLPEYMVPAAIIELDAIPLTSNGKIDRKAFPAPDTTRHTRAYEAPRSPTEGVIAQIWADLLRLERVGVDNNFFDLGGHSLLATQVASRVRKAFDVELGVRALFDAPTVAELAKTVETMRRTPAPPLVPVPRDTPLQLSFAQQRLWFLDQLDPDSSVYNLAGATKLVGTLHAGALAKSIDAVVARHEALRTTFLMRDGEPFQHVAPSMVIDMPIVEVASVAAATVHAEAEMRRSFDLSRGPLVRVRLLRLSEREHWLVLSMHHIVTDGWSMNVFIDEIAELYAADVEGRAPNLPALPVQYADFAAWQRAWVAGGVLEDQLAYWKNQLAGAPGLLQLPTDRPRPPTMSYRGAMRTFQLSGAVAAKLDALGRRESTTLFMTLLAAFQTLLYRYSGQQHIVVGSPVANRTRGETEPLIGFFVNTLVMHTDLSGQPTFRQVLERVREIALGAYAHQDVPFERLVEHLQPERNLSHTPLFQVMFDVQHGASRRSLAGIDETPLELDAGTSKFDLSLAFERTESGLTGRFEYATSLFDDETIVRMIGHLERLVTAAVDDPDRPIEKLPMLTEPERQQILVQWNATQRPVPQICIHDIVAQRAQETPDALAVHYDGRAMSYAQLDQKANALAHVLRAHGVGPEQPVGIFVERSLEMVIATLGVLKAGACYVPLDPAHPADRLSYMIRDAATSVVVAQSKFVARLEALGSSAAIVDASELLKHDGRHDAPPVEVRPESLAYIMYTSGSTGRPKGVMISHGAVVNFLQWLVQDFKLGPADRVLFFRSASFDVSVWELFGALASGASVIVAREQDPESLVKIIAEQQVTIATFNPSLLEVLLSDPVFCAVTSLRSVTCGGETLKHALKERFYAQRTGELCNTYGTTENTVASMCSRLVRGSAQVPSGRAIDNTCVYILDALQQPVPIGVIGEAYIGGAGVARGFLNRPELTAEWFLPDPFGPIPGARMYRTGDHVRWLPDGNLDFVGRIDDQVKIRGYRIELGEVEAAVAHHPGVREAAVIVREHAGGKQIVAYLVSEDDNLHVEDVRTFLRAQLPDYMVPAFIVMLDAFPLTPNGKVDRKALPAPDTRRRTEDHVKPRTRTELVVSQVFCDLLKVPEAGAHDDFFSLGGHSLLAMQLVAHLEAKLGIRLPVSTLLRTPTVEALARALDDHAVVAPSNLIELRSDGLRAPLVCIHPVGGSAFSYQALAARLAPDRPCYAFEAIGLGAGEVPLETVDALAAAYTTQLLAKHATGPFHILGWSFGGLVAVEMTRLLRAAGHEVLTTTVLDSFAPAAFALIETDPFSTLASFAHDLQISVDVRELRAMTAQEALAHVAKVADAAGAFPAHLGLDELARRVGVFAAHMRAAKQFVPRPVEGRFVMIRAAEALERGGLDPSVTWGPHVPGGFEIKDAPGDHYSMVAPPHVGTLATLVDEIIGAH